MKRAMYSILSLLMLVFLSVSINADSSVKTIVSRDVKTENVQLLI
jgi:hypothetical protein